jgi:hypothetical protein
VRSQTVGTSPQLIVASHNSYSNWFVSKSAHLLVISKEKFWQQIIESVRLILQCLTIVLLPDETLVDCSIVPLEWQRILAADVPNEHWHNAKKCKPF